MGSELCMGKVSGTEYTWRDAGDGNIAIARKSGKLSPAKGLCSKRGKSAALVYGKCCSTVGETG